MEALVIEETRKVLRDFDTDAKEYDGLIYMMFWVDDEQARPLYIGKSEKMGRNGSDLSANIRNIENNPSKFCRWGYSYDYHIGDLSAVACPGHKSERIKEKYQRWTERLFESFPSATPKLRRATYFWIEAWKYGSVGLAREYCETPLSVLEGQLIGSAGNLFPEALLNSRGVDCR